MEKNGLLSVVPTPVGNLGDITLRAIEVLKQADLILAEDTRTSGILLKHLQISNKLSSFHIHNEHKSLIPLIQRLQNGQHIALISDAGTPGISDPGFLLIRACLKEGIEVSCLPGATAFVPALVMSGFPSDRFCFEGFLPQKKGRKTRWEAMKQEPKTIICYESPHRLIRFLEEAKEYLPNNRVLAVVREISKKFESCIRGNAEQVCSHFQLHEPKGEIVVVIAPDGFVL